MKKLILTLFLLFHSPAFYARPGGLISSAIRQEPQAAPQSATTAEADKLNESVMRLYAERRYKEALPAATRVLALREQLLKDDDPLVGAALHNLVMLYIALGDAGNAEPLCERILARREKGVAPTPAPTMRVIAAYGCIQSAKGAGKNQASDLAKRVSKILLEDSIHAAGLTRPANFDEGKVKRLKSKQPNYPAEAKWRKLQGTMFVMLDIDDTGKVVSAVPLPCGSGVKPLADAAAEAALGGEFAPLVVAGRPINWKALVSYNFVLQ